MRRHWGSASGQPPRHFAHLLPMCCLAVDVLFTDAHLPDRLRLYAEEGFPPAKTSSLVSSAHPFDATRPLDIASSP
jgi:hypothetical protein